MCLYFIIRGFARCFYAEVKYKQGVNLCEESGVRSGMKRCRMWVERSDNQRVKSPKQPASSSVFCCSGESRQSTWQYRESMTDFTWLFIDTQQHTDTDQKYERSHSKFNQMNNHHQWAGVSIAAYQSHHARSEQRYLSSFQQWWRGRGDDVVKMKPNYLAKAEGGLKKP